MLDLGRPRVYDADAVDNLDDGRGDEGRVGGGVYIGCEISSWSGLGEWERDGDGDGVRERPRAESAPTRDARFVSIEVG